MLWKKKMKLSLKVVAKKEQAEYAHFVPKDYIPPPLHHPPTCELIAQN